MQVLMDQKRSKWRRSRKGVSIWKRKVQRGWKDTPGVDRPVRANQELTERITFIEKRWLYFNMHTGHKFEKLNNQNCC